jgi:hypothetical protein
MEAHDHDSFPLYEANPERPFFDFRGEHPNEIAGENGAVFGLMEIAASELTKLRVDVLDGPTKLCDRLILRLCRQSHAALGDGLKDTAEEQSDIRVSGFHTSKYAHDFERRQPFIWS